MTEEQKSKEESKRVDLALVNKCKDGDLSSFDILIKKYSRMIYVLINNMLANHEDTSDVMQDVFNRAFRSIHKFRGDAAFSSWLHRIAVNTTLNFIKKRNKRPVSSVDIDEYTKGVQVDSEFIYASSLDDPSSKANLNELKKKMNVALQKLSYNHRIVVVMFDIRGMSHNEISKILDINVGTIRSRLHYAHKELRKYLGEFV